MRQTSDEHITKRGIVPLSVMYATFGMFWGCMAVIMSDLLKVDHLGAGRIGFYFAVCAVVAIATMAWVAPRLEHLRREWTLPAALSIHAAGAFFLAELPSASIVVAFIVIGVGTGLVDVLVNAVGNEREQRTGKSVLQWVHMNYSLGSLGGAMVAGVLMTNGASFRVPLLVMALMQIAAGAFAFTSKTLRATPARERSETRFSVSAFRRWPALLIPGLIVCAAFFAEGSMDVWSGVYVRGSLDATVMGSAIAFSAFSLATALGRACAGLIFRLGYRRTILLSGSGSLAAGIAVVFAPNIAMAAIGYLVLGFFLSAAAPAAFGSVQGRDGVNQGVAIAAVTTVGYAGFVIGPPIMGWLADASGSFRITMVVLTMATAGVLVGGLLSPTDEPSAGSGAPEVTA